MVQVVFDFNLDIFAYELVSYSDDNLQCFEHVIPPFVQQQLLKKEVTEEEVLRSMASSLGKAEMALNAVQGE